MKKPSKELIEATANAIMHHFIPKDSTEKEFSFHFTVPPSFNYKVIFRLDDKGSWILEHYEADLLN